MSPIDHWIRNELWDIRSNDVALAARFLERFDANEFVGPEAMFTFQTLYTTMQAAYEIALCSLEMENLGLEYRCEAATIILVLSGVISRDMPSKDTICKLLKSRVENNDDAFWISKLIEAIAIYWWNDIRMRACCLTSIAHAGQVGDVEISLHSPVTRQKLIRATLQLRQTCIERNKSINAEYAAMSRPFSK